MTSERIGQAPRCHQDPSTSVALCAVHDEVPNWHDEVPGYVGPAGWVCVTGGMTFDDKLGEVALVAYNKGVDSAKQHIAIKTRCTCTSEQGDSDCAKHPTCLNCGERLDGTEMAKSLVAAQQRLAEWGDQFDSFRVALGLPEESDSDTENEARRLRALVDLADDRDPPTEQRRERIRLRSELDAARLEIKSLRQQLGSANIGLLYAREASRNLNALSLQIGDIVDEEEVDLIRQFETALVSAGSAWLPDLPTIELEIRIVGLERELIDVREQVAPREAQERICLLQIKLDESAEKIQELEAERDERIGRLVDGLTEAVTMLEADRAADSMRRRLRQLIRDSQGPRALTVKLRAAQQLISELEANQEAQLRVAGRIAIDPEIGGYLVSALRAFWPVYQATVRWEADGIDEPVLQALDAAREARTPEVDGALKQLGLEIE